VEENCEGEKSSVLSLRGLLSVVDVAVSQDNVGSAGEAESRLLKS
jgi:hypothetical protein